MAVGGTEPSLDPDKPVHNGHRRFRPLVLAAALVVVIVAALASWWAVTSDRPFGGAAGGAQSAQSRVKVLTAIDRNGMAVKDSAATAADPAIDKGAVCLPLSIATAGATTGPDAERDGSIKNGAQLAVDKHNAANPGCQVQLKPFDTAGDPKTAADTVLKIADDAYTVGVVGPESAPELAAMGDRFDSAGLAFATPSATSASLSQNGWKTFFRGAVNDRAQGESVAKYLKTSKYASVCVVDAGAPAGPEFVQAARTVLGPLVPAGCNVTVEPGATDVSAAVGQIARSSPAAVLYAGSSAGAASFVEGLRRGGVTAPFIGGGLDAHAAFAQQAGTSANGALLTDACAPATGPFADEYAQRFGGPPAACAVEAYDLTSIMLQGIDKGINTRPALLDFLHSYNGLGLAGRYQWTASGEIAAPLTWIYQVQ